MRPFLVVAVDDLMAGSRIEATARHLGYEVRYARSAEQFWSAVADKPAVVVLGTHHTRLPWEQLLATLRAHPDPPPVLAFGSHMDAETRARARRAGVTRWVANSRVATDLPSLIQELAGQRAAHASSESPPSTTIV
jgi:DNA-binding response OmpR family regulator